MSKIPPIINDLWEAESTKDKAFTVLYQLARKVMRVDYAHKSKVNYKNKELVPHRDIWKIANEWRINGDTASLK